MTPAQVKRRYGRLRSKYFMDAEPGVTFVPPTATHLTWVWAAETADYLGMTVFDEDSAPFELHLNLLLLRPFMGWELDRVLVHEMTHMRLGPTRSCASRKYVPYWRSEQERLTRLGFRWL